MLTHTLDAAPRPSFKYDSIDVFKSVICAFSLEGTEEQSFEEYDETRQIQYPYCNPSFLGFASKAFNPWQE